MRKLYLLLAILLLSTSAYAQGGMAGVGAVLILSVIGLISVLMLLIFSVKRFSKSKNTVHIGLNVAATLLICCSLLAIAILSSEIDACFLTTCIVMVLISVLLIILNYRIGNPKKR